MIIKGNLDLRDSLIESLGELKKVGGYLYLRNCKNLKDLGKLKQIGNNISLEGSGITEDYILENKPWLRPNCDFGYD